jgi:two-component system chemotaxis response regulator CheB
METTHNGAANYDVIVMGASAGGLATLSALLGALPKELPAAVGVVLHRAADYPSVLAEILERQTALPVVDAEDGVPLERGRIYVAPADRHLMLEPGRVRVVRGPKENRHRPAIDPLFRSAAVAYGPRVIGVVLTGTLDDGAAGLWAVKSCGGLAVVQDPADAQYPEMPRNALEAVLVDHCVRLQDLGPLLAGLVKQPAPTNVPASPHLDRLRAEVNVHLAVPARGVENMDRIGGKSSVYSCPSCKGVLWELEEAGRLRYRCHTGHAYSSEGLLDGQKASVENALWTATALLEERAAALRKVAEHFGKSHPAESARYEQEAKRREADAVAVKRVLRTPT